MRREERCRKIKELNAEINAKLFQPDFYKLKDLILWLMKSEDYKKLKEYDSRLQILDFFMEMWVWEKKDSKAFEAQGDIFAKVNSLEEIEEKYLCAKFLVLRIEADMPYEYCVEALDRVLDYQYSAYALYEIVKKCSQKHVNNLLKLSTLLKDRNELIQAIGLLQLAVEKETYNEELCMELADIWLSVKQWSKAYESLNIIKQPTQEVRELKQELEIMIKNETVQ